MAARHAIAPFWYYMFELYLPERKKQAALYLTAHETIGPAYSLLQPARGCGRHGRQDLVRRALP